VSVLLSNIVRYFDPYVVLGQFFGIKAYIDAFGYKSST
jgi:hypothetical protein